MGAPFHPRGTCSRLPAASESLPIGKAARGNRSIVGSGEDKLTVVQLAELRRKLFTMMVMRGGPSSSWRPIFHFHLARAEFSKSRGRFSANIEKVSSLGS